MLDAEGINSGRPPASDDRLRQLLQSLADVPISVDLAPTLDVLVGSLRQVIPFDAGGIFVHDPRRGVIRGCATRGYDQELEVPHSDGIVGAVLRTGQPRLVEDVTADPDYVRLRNATASQLTVPLKSFRGLIGAVSLESDRVQAFDDSDLGIVTLFAQQASVVIERALLHEQLLRRSRVDREIEIASDILQGLTPPLPTIKGVEMYGRSLVAHSVGGDAFDFIEYPDGQLGISIADPKGKGLPAALLAVAYRSMLRSLVGVDLRLRAMFARMNDLLAGSLPTGNFVTAFYGIVDLTERRMVYANAGHPPPLVVRASGTTEWLSVTGTLLGFPQPHPIREAYVNLAPGDGLVLYTDGVTEAGAADGAFLDPAGLETLVRQLWPASAEHIGEGILQEVSRRTHPDSADDATVVVMKLQSA